MKNRTLKRSSSRFAAASFIRKTVFFLGLLCSPLPALHAQHPLRTADLKEQEPSWYTVIGGEAVSPCIETSYGVAMLSDGRMLSACTNSGTVIWQRRIRGRPSPYLAPFGDFLYVVTDSSKLNLVNPSGLTLWTAVCPFAITAFPLVGRDGRVFVRGKRGLACYGLDGTRKWKADTEELGDFPVCELDDGSVFVILKNAKDGMSVAKRYSPFGEKLADITFSGIISSAERCDGGVLVSLKNGSIGLISAAEDSSMGATGAADSTWVNGSGNAGGAFRICWSPESGNAAFFFQTGSRTEAVIVRAGTGELLNRFQVGNIAPADFKLARATQAGYFITGSYVACEFSEDGTILYAASLPPADKWNSIFYTRENYIILCMKDWSMKAFLMNQLPKTSSRKEEPKPISYVTAAHTESALAEFGIRALTSQKMAEIARSFERGDYGEKEKEYLSLVKAEAQSYITESSTRAAVFAQGSGRFFAENAVYTQNLLYLMSKTGTREFSLLFSSLLGNDMDTAQLISLISFAGKCGYDEDGQMLHALENVLLGKLATSETIALKALADSTYEICRWMGRPALNKRGKNILTYMLSAQYDKNVQDYARKTLEKMIGLEKK